MTLSCSPARTHEPADDLVESCVCRREACDDVRAAYARWLGCSPEWHGLAFASDLAALEREENAATVYSVCAQVLPT
jgi:hypothetical protein